MGSFTYGKRMYNEAVGADPAQKPPNPVLVGLGIASAIVAEVLVYPLYCVKMNLQTRPGRGVLECARCIVREGGVPALYRGITIATAKTIPAACITFVVY